MAGSTVENIDNFERHYFSRSQMDCSIDSTRRALAQLIANFQII
jgi:hypothetical protein